MRVKKDTSAKASRTSMINTWKPKKEQIFVHPDGKLFACEFDKIFKNPKFKPYNKFMINKGSYENQLEVITKYINFFVNTYDKEDNELLMGYLNIKYALDKKKLFTADNMEGYIDFLYKVLFTDSMIKKIHDLVEDNYLDDIEVDTDEKKKYIKSDKKHLESLEFTNIHIKVLLRISFGMKIMSPVLFHYLALNVIKIEKDSEIIYNFYKRLFDIFGYGEKYDYHEANGKLIEGMIEPEVVEDLYKDGVVKKVICDSVEYYYYPDKTYYTHNRVNMYNKLYVYVSSLGVQK